MNNRLILFVSAIMLILLTTGKLVYAQDSDKNDQYVSKKQYDQLKSEMAKLQEQVRFLLQQQSRPQQAVTKRSADGQPDQLAKTGKDISELQEEVKTLKAQNEALDDGTTGFLLTGYAFAGYTDSQSSTSSFNAGFNPIFLWRLRDDLIFEGELELELEGNSTNVALEYAQLSYLLNDYVTIGVGKFLNPSNYFIERLHPAWINKLVDKPLTMA